MILAARGLKGLIVGLVALFFIALIVVVFFVSLVHVLIILLPLIILVIVAGYIFKILNKIKKEKPSSSAKNKPLNSSKKENHPEAIEVKYKVKKE